MVPHSGCLFFVIIALKAGVGEGKSKLSLILSWLGPLPENSSRAVTKQLIPKLRHFRLVVNRMHMRRSTILSPPAQVLTKAYAKVG